MTDMLQNGSVLPDLLRVDFLLAQLLFLLDLILKLAVMLSSGGVLSVWDVIFQCPRPLFHTLIEFVQIRHHFLHFRLNVVLNDILAYYRSIILSWLIFICILISALPIFHFIILIKININLFASQRTHHVNLGQFFLELDEHGVLILLLFSSFIFKLHLFKSFHLNLFLFQLHLYFDISLLLSLGLQLLVFSSRLCRFFVETLVVKLVI